GFGDESGGNCECCTASDPPDQLGSRNNIAPLGGTAHLDQAVSVLPEMVKIVPLQQLVAEFGKGKSAIPLQSLFDGVLRHHVVHGDVFSDIPDEIQKRKVLQPIVVVHHLGISGAAAKLQELFKLGPQALHIPLQDLLSKQLPFGGLE